MLSQISSALRYERLVLDLMTRNTNNCSVKAKSSLLSIFARGSIYIAEIDVVVAGDLSFLFPVLTGRDYSWATAVIIHLAVIDSHLKAS
jgi:hypothetical protein